MSELFDPGYMTFSNAMCFGTKISHTPCQPTFCRQHPSKLLHDVRCCLRHFGEMFSFTTCVPQPSSQTLRDPLVFVEITHVMADICCFSFGTGRHRPAVRAFRVSQESKDADDHGNNRDRLKDSRVQRNVQIKNAGWE